MNLYAKFEKEGSYLPLKTHLKDTACCAEYLYDYWLPVSVKNYLQRSLKLEDSQLKRFSILIAYLHDIGKATFIFQNKAWTVLQDPSAMLFQLCSINRETQKAVHHSTAGAGILNDRGFPSGITVIVGSHHGRWRGTSLKYYLESYAAPLIGTLNESERGLFFSDIWDEIINEALELTGFALSDLPNPQRSDQILLTGLLNMADWLASDQNLFPLYSPDTPALDETQRFARARENFQITEPWSSLHYLCDAENFQNTFNFQPRSIQNDVIKLLTSDDEIGLMIIEAPMGCGKTEAALYAAQHFAYTTEQGGLFYGLPTMATSNGLLGRISKWASAEAENGKLSLELVHSKTMFNESYQALRKNDFHDSDLVVSRWMEKRKLQLCPNFVLGTIDHLLYAALKHNHVMLDHIGMAGKVVILDEIHSFDAYTNQYLLRTLEWLGWYHAPVILLSATLTSSFRTQLVEAYLNGLSPSSKPDFSICRHQSYPAITFAKENEIQVITPDYQEPQKSILIKQFKDWSSIKENVTSRLADGGCAGIIVNTVRQAQDLYQEMEPLQQNGYRIHLLHSSFTDVDRAKKEAEIISILGKPEPGQETQARNNRNKVIVIGTQVLEQSLDIDFDWLITEICPVDLLFQRIGRLHRHDRERPAHFSTPECWIIGQNCEDLNSGTRHVYSDWLLMRTLDALKDKEHLILPSDIPLLIQAVYENEDTTNPSEKSAKDEYLSIQEDKISRAHAYLLSPPNQEQRNMRDLLNIRMDARGSLGDQAVRDGILSVEVILVGTDYQSLAYTSDKKPISLLEVPDSTVSRELLRSKIKLPSGIVKKYTLETILEELENKTSSTFRQWLNSKQIYGELVLPLDLEWKGKLDEWNIEYSFDTGLKFWKGDPNEESERIN